VSGTRPENVVTDKGLATRGVRALNTKYEIGSVGPMRKQGGMASKQRSAFRKDRVDEYGFPTCEFCGSPGTRKGSKARGFTIKNGIPYIAFVCANPHTDECKIRQQWIRCEEEWLLLGPISREEAIYYQLRRALRELEKTHDLQRERYENDGQEEKTRSRVLGLAWQRLNLAVGGFLEIFRVCLRLGVLGTLQKTFNGDPKRMRGGETGIKAMTRLRRMAGLLLPRGPKARELGLEFEGEIPADWTTVESRRKKRRSARNKKKKQAAKEAEAAAKARGAPPPAEPPEDDAEQEAA